jgi:monoamine oxidase
MRRRDFLKVCGILGIAPSLPANAESNKLKASRYSGSVLIIGAGAAGLSAAYLLEQAGLSVKVLEASNTYGGRLKRSNQFTDFPIALGAEWLHVSAQELQKIVHNDSIEVATQLQGYSGHEQVGYFEKGQLSYSALSDTFGRDFDDQKFIHSSWLDFFEAYLVPSIRSKIQFQTPVVSINTTGKRVVVTDQQDRVYHADKVILTVPLKMLQNQTIDFNPQLPFHKLRAIQRAPIWGGIKVFIEFSESFYPTFLTFSDSETVRGQRMYFDAAYGQTTASKILGLFAVGQQAKPYQALAGKVQMDYILDELDRVFDGKASQHYVKHRVQDWSQEPFIHSAYLADGAASAISSDLSTSIDEKLYFAGEAYTQEDDWGGVHNATRSAKDAVEEILGMS